MQYLPIDLSEIETVVVGRASDRLRADHMRRMTARLSLKARFPEGVTASPNFVGCAISHIRACLQPDLATPFLLLEDDAVETERFTPRLSVPSDADIIFVGITSYGLAPGIGGRALERAAITEEVDQTWARVHSMTGAHALLFVSERGREAYVNAAKEYVTARFRPHDIALHYLARHLNLYALIRPAFYQAEKLQPEGKTFKAERASISDALLRQEGQEVELPAGKYGRLRLRLVRRDNGMLEWEAA